MVPSRRSAAAFCLGVETRKPGTGPQEPGLPQTVCDAPSRGTNACGSTVRQTKAAADLLDGYRRFYGHGQTGRPRAGSTALRAFLRWNLISVGNLDVAIGLRFKVGLLLTRRRQLVVLHKHTVFRRLDIHGLVGF